MRAATGAVFRGGGSGLTSFGLGATIETDLSTHDREAGGFQPVQLPEAGGGLGRVAKGGLCQMR